jgi:4-hydroxy-tetrahydrodipicolinate synthase
MIFKGSGVALVTPFTKDNKINYDKLEELIEYQIKNLTDAIIICGTTGEGTTLTINEFKEVVDFSIKAAYKRIPIIVGTGSNDTKKAINLSKYANSVGADGLLVVTPYYNKCSQEGLYLHFKEIADNVDLPIILYNVPSRTGVNILPETILRLSSIKNIVGIKEASGDISQIVKIASLVNSDFAIYSGNDDQILPILSLGGAGIISVAANIIPKEIHYLCKSFFDGNIDDCKKIQFKYLDIMNKLFIEVNPMPIKEAMNIIKFDVGECRLPLCSISDKNKLILKESIEKILD